MYGASSWILDLDRLNVNPSPVDLLVLRAWKIYLVPFPCFLIQKCGYCLIGFWLHCDKHLSPTEHTINNGNRQTKMRAFNTFLAII